MVERRATERFRIEAPVEVSVRGRSESVIAYDLSIDGCMIEASSGSVEAGDAIALAVPKGISAEGTIVWTKHRNAGVRFAAGMRLVAVERIAKACAPPGPSGGLSARSARERWRASACGHGFQQPRADSWRSTLNGIYAAAAAPEDRKKLAYILHYAFSVTMVACAAVLLLR